MFVGINRLKHHAYMKDMRLAFYKEINCAKIYRELVQLSRLLQICKFKTFWKHFIFETCGRLRIRGFLLLKLTLAKTVIGKNMEYT